MGFLSIFKRRQSSSPFEALNTACLSTCQMDVSPPVEMRQGTRAFAMASKGDSDIPSASEMKDEPAFKSLQGNPALLPVRASWCPFHLSQQTQGPSYIPISERSLLLSCAWKIGHPLEMKEGHRHSSPNDLDYTEPFQLTAVTSGILQFCDGVPADSLEFRK